MSTRNLNVKELPRYDVAVIGGGTAGLPAAIAASRRGARVLLVEDSGSVGGLLISGLPLQGFDDENGRSVTGGIFREFLRRLTEAGGSTGPVPHETEHCVLASVDPPIARCVALEMAAESDADLLLHTRLVSATREGGTILEAILAGKSGLQSLTADVFIDATGDGDLAAMADFPFEKGRPEDGLAQTPALLFRLGGVDIGKLRTYFKDNPQEYLYAELLREGQTLTEDFLGKTLLFSGFSKQIEAGTKAGEYNSKKKSLLFCTLPRSDQVLMNTVVLLGLDATDQKSLTDGEIAASAEILPLVRFIQKRIPGFEKSHLIEVDRGLAIRESRRIMGDYVLTVNDIQQREKFEDAVVLGSHFIDIHPVADSHWETIRIRGTYEIPYRCLLPRGADNLLMAGRCISATHEAHASLRIMSTCVALGEAAGTAAGIAIEDEVSPRKIDGTKLKEILVEPLLAD